MLFNIQVRRCSLVNKFQQKKSSIILGQRTQVRSLTAGPGPIHCFNYWQVTYDDNKLCNMQLATVTAQRGGSK